jgi:hypothetical protein
MISGDDLRKKALPLALGGLAVLLVLSLALSLALEDDEEDEDDYAAGAGPYGNAAPVYGQPNGPQGVPRGSGQPVGPNGMPEDPNIATNAGPGYAAPATGTLAPATATGYAAPNANADATNKAIMDSYWARQRSQDQNHQQFMGYIRDTTTIRDTQTGEIHKDVDNTLANPSIESGAATAVPTSELPTSYDSSASGSSSSTTE